MGFLSSLTGGSKSTSTSATGWEARPDWAKQYDFQNLFPQMQAEASKPYEQVGYQNYVAGMSPQQMQAISNITGGGLSGGGLRGGLEGVTGMNNFSSRFADPYMQQAGDLTGQGAQRINYNDVEAARNPYAGALQNRLNEEMNKTMAAKKAQLGMRGGRSFGDISTGTQLGALEAERQSKMSDIDYNTYRDAMASEEALKNRQMAGGGQFGQLAGQAQNITNQQFANELNKYQTMANIGQNMASTRLNTEEAALRAGGLLQQQNQSINDAKLRDELEKRGYSGSQLDEAFNRLNNYNATMNTQTSKSNGGLMQAMGQAVGFATGTASLGSGLGNLFGGGTTGARSTGTGTGWTY